jgi:hypothetical protein
VGKPAHGESAANKGSEAREENGANEVLPAVRWGRGAMPVRKEPKACRAWQERKVPRGRTGRRAKPGRKARLAHKAFRDPWVHRVPLDLRARLVLPGRRVRLVLRALKVRLVHRGRPGHKDLRERQDRKARKGPPAQPDLLASKAFLDSRERQDRKGWLEPLVRPARPDRRDL